MRIMSYKKIILCTFCSLFITLMVGCPIPTAPPAISAPTLIAGNEQLTASWIDPTTWNWGWGENNTNNDITEYHLRYREDGGEGWTEINTGITTSHTITELTNGDTYHVQVRAVNAQGIGGWSASATARPIAPTVPPAAPGTMAAPTFEVGNGQLSATWTAPKNDGGSPITGYELQYRTDDGDWTLIRSGITCASSTGAIEGCHFSFSSYSSYTIHSITTDGANYQLQVRAVNEQGAGEWSASAMFPFPFATQLPAGTPAVVIVPADIDNPLAPEIATELSVSLTTVGASNITVEDGEITAITPVATPDGVTPPTVDSSSGFITLTVTDDTTAGTYVIYDDAIGTDGQRFAEYFSVTLSPSPQTNAELQTAVNAGIATWGNTADLNYIITTAVKDMSGMFNGKYTFNGDVSRWDVSSVTNMSNMFITVSAFNGDISGWDVSSVTTMQSMFQYATAFNVDISGWDVSSVTNMPAMFNGAIAFNQDLEEWKNHWTPATGNKLTTADPPKYNGTKTNMFMSSGVNTTNGNVPSWYE
ncbi:MAG: BspA family leucine-rich repeat surface protein [Salinispira sp.]